MKYLRFFIFTLFSPFIVLSQDVVNGSHKNLIIKSDTTIISETVYVSDSLIIKSGAILKFINSSSIIANGYTSIIGTENSRIKFLSEGENTGIGLVIANVSNELVTIENTDFINLNFPINFDFGWFRSFVRITNCQFIKNTSSNSVIQILNPNMVTQNSDIVAKLLIQNNLFVENHSAIYVEDFSSNILDLTISDNVFTNNLINYFGKYTFSTNVIYGRLDKMQTNFKTKFSNNSFSNNLLVNSSSDSVLQKANFGIYGSGDSLIISNNYFGESTSSEISSTIYDFTKNYTTPKLVFENYLVKPSPLLPSHIYHVELYKNITKDSSAIPLIPDSFNITMGLKLIKLYSNKEIRTNRLNIHYYYSKDSIKVYDTIIQAKSIKYADNITTIEFNNSTDSLFKSNLGYLILEKLEGNNNNYIPPINIGSEFFRRSISLNKKTKEKILISKDSIKTQKDILIPIISKFKRKYEVGFVSGYSIYYGTLSNKRLFKNDINSLIGFQFKYGVKQHITVGVAVTSFTLSGSDLKSNDSLKIQRGMSFKTPVLNVGFQLDYDYYDNSIYSSKNVIKPSIGFGINYSKFNPQGEYLGKWYALQPLGTGGQNIPDNATKPYQLSSLGLFISVSAKYHISKNLMFSLFANYNLAFTEYLDDVGPDQYPDPSKLALTLSSDIDAAKYFANPTNLILRPGQLRSGSLGGSDSFLTFGFSIAHHF